LQNFQFNNPIPSPPVAKSRIIIHSEHYFCNNKARCVRTAMVFNIHQACCLQAIVLAMCSRISASAIASASAGRPFISAMGTKPALQACTVLSVCSTIDEMRLGPILSFDVDAADAHALVPFGWEFEPSIGSSECTTHATALVVWGSVPCRHSRTEGSPRLECGVIADNDVAREQLVLQLPSPIKVSASRALVAASYFARPQRQQESVVPQDRPSKARLLLHMMINAPKSLKLVLRASPARERFLIVAFFRPEYEWCVVQEAGASDAPTTPCTTTELLVVTKRLWPIMLIYGSVWFITQVLWAFLFPFCLNKLCALVLWCCRIPGSLRRYLLTRQSTSIRELDEVCRTPNVKAALALTAEQAEEVQALTMVVYTFTHQPRLPHAQCQVLIVVRPDHIVVTTNNAGRRSTEFDIDKMIEKLDAALACRWSAPPALGESEWQAPCNVNECATVQLVVVTIRSDGREAILVMTL
jgi:hypothetical protein